MKAFEEIDVHSLTKAEAISMIDRLLKTCDGKTVSVRVVHGFHRGTTLQTTIRKHYAKHPRVLRVELGMNPGETDLILRENPRIS